MKRFVCMLALIVTLVAPGSYAFDLMTPRGIGMGRTVPMSMSSATGQLNLPARGLERGGWIIEGGYNRRFELSDLDQLFLAAAWRWEQMTFALGVSQFGKSDFYAEQTLKGSLSFQYDSLSVSLSASGLQVQLGNNYGRLRAASIGAGLSYRWRRLLVAVTADNLTHPKLTDYSERFESAYNLYTEVMGKGGAYSITGRLTMENLQKPQFGLGQIIRLSRHGSFFWGIASAPLEFGGGLEVNIPSGSLTYATSVHPVLGFSHTVSFTYGSTRRKARKTDEFK